MTQLQLGRTLPTRQVLRRAGAWAGLWIVGYAINERIWDWLLFSTLGLDIDSRPVEVLHFFLYDTVKIALLITGITFAVTVLRSFMTIERTRALLSGKRAGVGNVVAAGLGVITPFCSCSAVPAFIGFISAGVPVGVTMSFLIASPLVNEIAVGLLAAWFGVRIAVYYMIAGLTIAILSGMVIGRIGAERWVESFVLETRASNNAGVLGTALRPQDRLVMAVEEVRVILKKVWPYLLVGIAIGAVLHGWAPTAFFAKYASADTPYGVLVAVLVGIPLYSNAAGALPIVQVLADQGLPMGTLLAFMMAVVGLSLPELVLLRRVLKPQLLAVFVAIVGSGILIIGYLFNAILA